MYEGVSGLITVTATIFTSIFVASAGSLPKHLHEPKIFFIPISFSFHLLFLSFLPGTPPLSPRFFIPFPFPFAGIAFTLVTQVSLINYMSWVPYKTFDFLRKTSKMQKSKCIYIPFILFKIYKKIIVKRYDFLDKNGHKRVLREGNNGLAHFSGDSSCGDFMANIYKP